MDPAAALRSKFRALAPWFDEATLRVWAAVEARSLGRGGVSAVAKAMGLSRTTIHAGLAELRRRRPKKGAKRAGAHSRAGGGRKKLTLKDPTLLRDLEALGGTLIARGSAVAAALDLQEHHALGGGVRTAGARGQPAHACATC